MSGVICLAIKHSHQFLQCLKSLYIIRLLWCLFGMNGRWLAQACIMNTLYPHKGFTLYKVFSLLLLFFPLPLVLVLKPSALSFSMCPMKKILLVIRREIRVNLEELGKIWVRFGFLRVVCLVTIKRKHREQWKYSAIAKGEEILHRGKRALYEVAISLLHIAVWTTQ